jgi:hypothetical protein
MRPRGMISFVAVLCALAPLAAHSSARPPVVRLVISNFRYCKQAPCSATDSAYVRSSNGGALVDNPAAAITVKAGSIVRWTYMDDFCDSFNYGSASCPGHEVRLENGTPGGGRSLGLARARQRAPQVITFRVPKSYAGRSVRYFCNLNMHWMFGLTGALQITK